MKYFTNEEFDCKCGCGLNNIKNKLQLKLEKARDIAGVPFIINSGCRCKTHNIKIKGGLNSSHLKGQAADIKADNNNERFLILQALILQGFRRIGIGRTFIHADIDDKKTNEIIWLYK